MHRPSVVLSRNGRDDEHRGRDRDVAGGIQPAGGRHGRVAHATRPGGGNGGRGEPRVLGVLERGGVVGMLASWSNTTLSWSLTFPNYRMTVSQFPKTPC